MRLFLLAGLFLGLPFMMQALDRPPLPIPPLLESEVSADGHRIFRLTALQGRRQFFDGAFTSTLGYNGDYLGPTIRVRRGENVEIRVENRLRDPTTVHWHGADVPAEADGGPHQPIAPGETWSPAFQIRQQAATLWYHPHFMGSTAKQVYEGLAGLFIVDDDASDALGLPSEYGVDDVPLILQERRFDRNGQFSFAPTMPDVMHGYFGNVLLVNGAPSPVLKPKRSLLRLRVLNGSNSSLFRLTIDGGPEFHLVASDGGFLEKPVPLNVLILSPGERGEIVVDLSRASGAALTLKVESNGGRVYEALRIESDAQSQTAWKVPQTLLPPQRLPESVSDRSRSFVLTTGMGARMTINGKVMNPNRIDERVPLGNTEIWEISNRSGRMMMNQVHSFHAHAVQFFILSINGRAPPPALSGRKDTILVQPGDRIRIIAQFDSYPGLYMYHCHMLEHEDSGMMGQFLIEQR